MDIKKYSGQLHFCAWISTVLFAGFFLIPAAYAQQNAQQNGNERFLLIFDTSAAMKDRVPAVQKALDNLFVLSMGGQLLPGDSIGVWTFDQDLHAGEFPLQYWMPSEAATIDADIKTFVEKQRYSKTTHFETLQPALDQLVKNSGRLTVLIFCDGKTDMSGTPYDNGINQVFQQRQAAQQIIQQPFIVILRAQLGQYVGCTVNFPPSLASFPGFPPLPQPPAPPEPTNKSSPTPAPERVMGPSIIMINTNVETKPLPKPAAHTNGPPPTSVESTNQTFTPTLEVMNLPLPAVPTNSIAETNSTVETNIATQTNSVSDSNITSAPEKTSTPPTNAPAATPKNSGSGSAVALTVGAAFLIAAGGLGFFLLRRSRKSGQSSLITRSMRKR